MDGNISLLRAFRQMWHRRKWTFQSCYDGAVPKMAGRFRVVRKKDTSKSLKSLSVNESLPSSSPSLVPCSTVTAMPLLNSLLVKLMCNRHAVWYQVSCQPPPPTCSRLTRPNTPNPPAPPPSPFTNSPYSLLTTDLLMEGSANRISNPTPSSPLRSTRPKPNAQGQDSSRGSCYPPRPAP